MAPRRYFTDSPGTGIASHSECEGGLERLHSFVARLGAEVEIAVTRLQIEQRNYRLGPDVLKAHFRFGARQVARRQHAKTAFDRGRLDRYAFGGRVSRPDPNIGCGF